MCNHPHILIVEDDAGFRRRLEQMLHRRFPQLKVSACGDGLAATRILEAQQADIVITDIQMPHMTGLELLEWLNHRHYQCKTVIISGYDEYNLMRDAMRLGAMDYLLKPVQEESFIQTLQEVLAAPLPPASGPDLVDMQILLEHFINQAHGCSPLVAGFLAGHGITPDTYCLLGAVQLHSLPLSRQLAVKHRMGQCLTEMRANKKKECLALIWGEVDAHWMFLAFFEKEPPYNPEICPLRKELEAEHLHLSTAPGYFHLRRIEEARRKCLRNLERHYFDLSFTRAPSRHLPYHLHAVMEMATDAAVQYDSNLMTQCLDQAFFLLNQSRPPIRSVRKAMSEFIYRIMSRNPRFIPVISDSKFTSYDIIKMIETTNSLSALHNQITHGMKRYISQLAQAEENKDEYIIQRAKEYIHANYHSGITLGDVASHVFLHTNYFSTLFKQKTGTTFRKYLRAHRIHEAQRLLKGTKLHIYEIAEQVGYHEPAHFIRAFKEVSGCSPSIYRQKALAEARGHNTQKA